MSEVLVARDGEVGMMDKYFGEDGGYESGDEMMGSNDGDGEESGEEGLWEMDG